MAAGSIARKSLLFASILTILVILPASQLRPSPEPTWVVATETDQERWGQVLSISISPDGHSIAWGTDLGHVLVAPIADLEDPIFLPVGVSSIAGLDHSPNGQFLAIADGRGDVHLWNFTADRIEWSRNLTIRGMSDLMFSHDGSRIVTANGDGDCIVLTIRGDEFLRFFAHDLMFYNVWTSRDGALIVTTGKDAGLEYPGVNITYFPRIRIWSAENGSLLAESAHQVYRVNDLVERMDGETSTLVAAGYDQLLVLSGPLYEEEEIIQTGGFVSKLAASPDGSLLIRTRSDRVPGFVIDDGSGPTDLFSIETASYAWDLEFSPVGVWFAAALYESRVAVWGLDRDGDGLADDVPTTETAESGPCGWIDVSDLGCGSDAATVALVSIASLSLIVMLAKTRGTRR